VDLIFCYLTGLSGLSVETIAAYGMSNFPVEMLHGFTIFHIKATEILCQKMGLRTVTSGFDFAFFGTDPMKLIC
jgi:hypothetical protein